jgi:hypothetical protein
MAFTQVEKYTNRVNLSVGDIIIDVNGGHTGILVNRRRHIDIVEDDIYVWEAKWNTNVINENPFNAPLSSILEEESLKLSIVVGIYEWHSVNGETFELEI